ncbi:MAG: 4-hydroxythreonine-4-phosphate dehydrogenase [Deltaproteobacteria bacterium]|nr:4-hydroxythreonine-4-phosphate dehydrogenase [Deltaproteobacteria bacterium]
MSARAAGRVRLAISMGDPGGIGPEVVLKALATPAVAAAVDPILVGDRAVWDETARRLRLRVATTETPRPRHLTLTVTSTLPPRHRRPGPTRGKADAAARGEAAYRAIVEAVRLVQAGRADAVVTAPISKAHLGAAGHDFPGHTELLANLCGNVPVRMMMAGPQLRVVLVTTHLALAEVPRRLSREAVLDTILATGLSLRQQFRIPTPRIAVSGLNPHAGENGLFGDEEARIIAPAIRAARRRRIDVRGPLAADSLFAQAAHGQYDAVVCMYHDQGLGPFKLLHFADGVNFTVGLPFVRTSPDHGTAFDLAGTGTADARSMIAAMQLAARLARPPTSAVRARRTRLD